MKQSAVQTILAGFLVLFGGASCGDATFDSEAPAGQVRQALTQAETVLDFEGSIGTAPGSDWVTVAGTATSSNTAYSGAHSMQLGNDWNPQAISKSIAIGPISDTATIRIRLSSGYSCQGSWCGQVALFATAPSKGLYTQYIGPIALSGPIATWKEYSIPVSSAIVGALASGATDFSPTVVINSSAPTNTLLVDTLSFGQQMGGGGTGGSGGGGSGGTGGATGGSPPGGGVAGMTAWEEGMAVDSLEVPWIVPSGDDLTTVALGAFGTLKLNDGVNVLAADGTYAAVTNLGVNETNIGVSAKVGDVTAKGSVVLRNFARVKGSLQTGGILTKYFGAFVEGTTSQHSPPTLVAEQLGRLRIPLAVGPAVTLAPGAQQALTPGRYGALTLNADAIVTLEPGTYYFDSITLEPGSSAVLQNNLGPITLMVRDSVILRGTFDPVERARMNVLLAYFGSAFVPVEAPFWGAILAPNAKVSLASFPSLGHIGSVFAKEIELHQHTPFIFRPYELWHSLGIDEVRDDTTSTTLAWTLPNPVMTLDASTATSVALKTHERTQPEGDPLLATRDSGVLTMVNDLRMRQLLGLGAVTALEPYDARYTSHGDSILLRPIHPVTVNGNLAQLPILDATVVAELTPDGTALRRATRVGQTDGAPPAITAMPVATITAIAIADAAAATGLPAISIEPRINSIRLGLQHRDGTLHPVYLVPIRNPIFTTSSDIDIPVDASTGAIDPSWRRLLEIIEHLHEQLVPGLQGGPDGPHEISSALTCLPTGFGNDREAVERRFDVGTAIVDGNPQAVSTGCRYTTLRPLAPVETDPAAFELPDPLPMWLYSSPDSDFSNEPSVVEAAFWGERVVQFFEALGSTYRTRRYDADVDASTPDELLPLRAIAYLRNPDPMEPEVPKTLLLPVTRGFAAGQSISLHDPGGFFPTGVADGVTIGLNLDATTDPSIVAHEFTHSVSFDALGFNETPSDLVVREGLSNSVAFAFNILHENLLPQAYSAPGNHFPFAIGVSRISSQHTAQRHGVYDLSVPEAGLVALSDWARNRLFGQVQPKLYTDDPHYYSGVIPLATVALVFGDDVHTSERAVVPDISLRTSLASSSPEEAGRRLAELVVGAMESGRPMTTVPTVIASLVTEGRERAASWGYNAAEAEEKIRRAFDITGFGRSVEFEPNNATTMSAHGDSARRNLVGIFNRQVINDTFDRTVYEKESLYFPQMSGQINCESDEDIFLIDEQIQFDSSVVVDFEASDKVEVRLYQYLPCPMGQEMCCSQLAPPTSAPNCVVPDIPGGQSSPIVTTFENTSGVIVPPGSSTESLHRLYVGIRLAPSVVNCNVQYKLRVFVVEPP